MPDTARPADQILPWQQEQWNRLSDALERERLAHALLLVGPPGVGKRQFIRTFGKRLLCQAPAPAGACGQCHACHLWQAGNQPDLVTIEPEESGKAIRVDAIRGYLEKAGLTAQGHWRLVIIDPADAMNMAAANSILKTLEEPTANTLMVLISEHPERLPATIQSRCQRLDFLPPKREVAKQWLAPRVSNATPDLLLDLANEAPLKALELDDAQWLQARSDAFADFRDISQGKRSAVTVAAEWSGGGFSQKTEWMLQWVVDLCRLKVTDAPPKLSNPDLIKDLNVLAKALELSALQSFLKRLYEVSSSQGSQLNPQMQLEGLLIAWSELGGSKRGTS